MEDIVGKKRTAFEADLDSKIPKSTEKKVMLVKHFRDYAYSQTKGGSKGEKADYILYPTADNKELLYAPIISKIKLNKKRKAQMQTEEGEVQIRTKTAQAENIVLAARGYSKEEA